MWKKVHIQIYIQADVYQHYFGKAPVYKPLEIKKPVTPLQKTLDKLAKMK